MILSYNLVENDQEGESSTKLENEITSTSVGIQNCIKVLIF
jgi:hypothetical protein